MLVVLGCRADCNVTAISPCNFVRFNLLSKLEGRRWSRLYTGATMGATRELLPLAPPTGPTPRAECLRLRGG